MFRVIVSDEQGETTTIPSAGDEVTIGRDHSNTVWLNERNISRKHARIRLKSSKLWVEDLNSYLGLKVNGRGIQTATEVLEGDKIQVGDFILTVQLDTENASLQVLTNRTQKLGLSENPDTATTVVVEAPKALLSPKLVFLSGPLRGKEFLISRPVTQLGRDDEHANIVINHKSISRNHAEIILKDDACRIRDLGSSNGIRVNHQPCAESALRSGDLIELGVIKARLVGTDDPYRIEMDPAFERSSKHSSLASKPNTSKHRLLYIMLGGLALAGTVAFSIIGMIRSGSDQKAAERLVTNPPTTLSVPKAQPQANASASTGETFSDALERCQTAFSSSQYEEAVHYGTLALRLKPRDPEAAQCERAAQVAWAEEKSYFKGLEAMREGNIDLAFQTFDKLPLSSIYRNKPEVKEAAMTFAKAKIAKIESLLVEDPGGAKPSDAQRSEAKQLAWMLTTSKLVPKEYAMQARRLIAPAPVVRAPRPAPALSNQPSGPARRPPPAAGTLAPFEAAKICLAQGDQRCAIVSLEGKARSARELGLLVETYRAVGDTVNALRTMHDFVTNYPNDPRSVSYSQFLQQHEK